MATEEESYSSSEYGKEYDVACGILMSENTVTSVILFMSVRSISSIGFGTPLSIESPDYSFQNRISGGLCSIAAKFPRG
jgi:hypothetical protein